MVERANRTGVDRAIVRRRDPDGGWELVHGRPGPGLRGAVSAYEGYRESMTRPLRRRELPSARIVVIIDFGPGFRLLDPNDPGDPARAVVQHGGFVAGLDDAFAVTESTGQAHCLQLNLAPLAAWRLFGRPMSDLARQVIRFEDLLGPEAGLLTERLAEQPAWEARFALLDAILLDRLAAAPQPAPEVVWVWRQLARSAGQAPIAPLAAELGWSPKRLITRFREQIGLPPKQTARLLRFERAAALLSGTERPDWRLFARQHGFYDQSHLINEFRQFAGDTPEGVIRRRISGGGGFAAD